MDKFVPFDKVNTAEMRHDVSFDFMFPSKEIEDHYTHMLKSFCPVCGVEMKSLSALNRHANAAHQMSYCDLCIRYSRLLPCESVLMTPAELAEHRRWDKKKKKGHPLCNFCQERFYEFEDLVHHVRDRHFLCDLCNSTGKFVVFREQWELLQHYGDSHHLCAECRAQQRISCFATADRLGLHRFQEHPTEVANDPDPWLPVTIKMAPVAADELARRRGDAAYAGVDRISGILSSTDGTLIAEGTDTGVRFRRPNPSEWTGDDFPSLHSASSTTVAGSTGTSSVRESYANTTERQKDTTTAAAAASEKATNRSTLAFVTSRGRNTTLTKDDFPSLPGSSGTTSGLSPARWIKTGSQLKESRPQHAVGKELPMKTPNPSPIVRPTLHPIQNVPAATEFPSLSPQSSTRRPEWSILPSYTPIVNQKPKKQGDSHDFLPTPIEVNDSVPPDPSPPIVDQKPVSNSKKMPEPSPEDFPSLNRNNLGNAHPGASEAAAGRNTKSSILETASNNTSQRKVKDVKQKSTVKERRPFPTHDEIDTECIVFAEAKYTPAPDENSRNLELLKTIEASLFDVGGKTTFARFADLSRRYSHKHLTASAYMEGISGLLSPHQGSLPNKENSSDSTYVPLWVAPMISLLPNIGLQRALLRVLKGEGAPRLPSTDKSSAANIRRSKESIVPTPVWAKSVLALLQCCRICGQVCLRADLKQHLQLAHSES